MSSRAIKDLTKTLQAYFSPPDPPASLTGETRRALQNFVDGQRSRLNEEEWERINNALSQIFHRQVEGHLESFGAFVGVLQELSPLIVNPDDLAQWWTLVGKTVLCGSTYCKAATQDAHAFVLICLLGRESSEQPTEAEDVLRHSATSERILRDLLSVYIARSRSSEPSGQLNAVANARAVQSVEEVLVAYGRKRPEQLFRQVDEGLIAPDGRLQALTLLTSFLRHETPHIYVVSQTPLVENLLKCLMNDTSTAVLSASLNSLIMLMPHIPSFLASHLPRLFLIYSRLLCWEKFSPLSTASQRSLVTDNRLPAGSDSEEEYGSIGLDTAWKIARPESGEVEVGTPELLTYYTFLYGLYPLNLSSYIRKSRRYLKNAGFPGAEDFDLDQAVIRGRSEQFREAHLAHPNFFCMTIEEELSDPKWLKSDPADVVAACNSLCVDAKTTSKSHASLSASSTDVTLDQDMIPVHELIEISSLPESLKDNEKPRENITYLHHETALLRNKLHFEEWQKAQFAQHIGRLTRKNVKSATAEAETLNLINANRVLKQQLEQLREAREATIKDSILTRKQASNFENSLTERLNKLKREQEVWQADNDELHRLRGESRQYRELLVTIEARELNTRQRLAAAEQDMATLAAAKTQLSEAQQRLRGFEYRDFEFQRAARDREITDKENQLLKLKVARFEEDRDRLSRMYRRRVAQIRTDLDEPVSRRSDNTENNNMAMLETLQRAFAETQTKFAQLKRAHARLVEKYTELECNHQAAQTQINRLAGSYQSPIDLSPLSRVDHDPFASSASAISYNEADAAAFDLDDAAWKESHYLLSSSAPLSRQMDQHHELSLRRPSNDHNEATLVEPAGLMWPHKARRYDFRASQSPRSIASPSISSRNFSSATHSERFHTDIETPWSVDTRRSNTQTISDDIVDERMSSPASRASTSPSRSSGRRLVRSKDRARSQGPKTSKSGAFRGLKNIL